MVCRIHWPIALILFAVSVAQAEGPGNKAGGMAKDQPPVANAGLDKTVKAGSRVVLNGSSSSDPEGAALSYQWSQTRGESVELKYLKSPTPAFTAPLVGQEGATLEFHLVVTENLGERSKSSAPDKVVVTVQSAIAPPNCDLATPGKSTLSPANRKMYRIPINNVIDDINDPYNIVTLDILGVTQDEPVHGKGDNTAPDAVIQVADPFDTVLLRAERSDSGDGRVYVIRFKASDGFESCEGSVSVSVPPKVGTPAIDSGLKVDSTRP